MMHGHQILISSSLQEKVHSNTRSAKLLELFTFF